LKPAAKTRDGTDIQVEVNIGSGENAELEYAAFADGVGLFRTEFLYLGRPQLPGEEEQLAIYQRVLKGYGSKPVVMRTLDIGGDKQIEALPIAPEPNPFLGKRALRLCFEREDIFRTQLRAALCASVCGNLRIMFPMVGSMEDFRRAKAFLEQTAQQLREEGREVSGNIKIGAMVEIPAIALIADKLAREADFASIGTNDLCQYLTAADRMNQAVGAYYQSYHPAVFRAIGMIAREFTALGKITAVCGELAGDVMAAPALIGLGVRTLSMSAAVVAAVKETISKITLEEALALGEQVKQADTAQEVKRLLYKAHDTIQSRV
jgi:phosphotransferase system enzyme I (PtsI)